MNKDQIISAKILSKLSEGMTIEQAFDAVLGVGAYAAIASAVYDEMQG